MVFAEDPPLVQDFVVHCPRRRIAELFEDNRPRLGESRAS